MSKKWLAKRKKGNGCNLDPMITPFKTLKGNDVFARRRSAKERRNIPIAEHTKEEKEVGENGNDKGDVREEGTVESGNDVEKDS